jgi:serine/threonine-protein kinase
MPEPQPTTGADRNLLFGVLCLQADIIDEAQFAEACTTWSRKRDMPLADVLRDRGWLTDAERSHIDFLLQRKLQKHGGDARRSLGAVADSGVRDVLRSLDDDGVRRTLSQLAPAPGYVLVTTMDQVLGRRSRYTLTRVYAEGGLGRVYVAYDPDVNREVALKELLPQRAANPEAWGRFFREAQLTGQLEHPNIVPVYEIGRREEDGQPFYTMRLVRGQTLREAISAYHRRRADEHRDDPIERLRLLRAFETVCQAVSYAHARGVVHRDLKPENVMLGDFGQVILLDWGLAKLLDRAEEDGDVRGVSVNETAQTNATMAGRMLGTPAYAAPEQAEGRIDLIDARTDVYGLGAILFEILSGRPPHKADSTAEMLRHIVTEETPRARAFEPSVPRALDAICARAMAKARADRYGCAADLARDVQSFLADEPVTAYREPPLTRMGRWARRHRSLVGTGAALTAAAVLFLTVLAVLLEGARERTDQARAQAEANFRLAESERQRAEDNFRKARVAVDDYFTRVSENRLLGMPHLEPLRQQLLEQARTYYQGFAAEAGSDPKVLQDNATAVFRVATITNMIGSREESNAHYRKAIALYEPLVAGNPDRPDWAARLAICSSDYGVSLMETGQMEDARRSLDRGRSLLERATAEDPKQVTFRTKLAKVLVNIAVWNVRAGKVDKALAAYERGRKLQEDAVREGTDDEVRADLALTIMNIGSLRLDNGRPEASLVDYHETLKIQEDLVARHPNSIYYMRLLGAVHHNIGLVHRRMSRPHEALAHYQKAMHGRQRLLDLHPAVVDYQSDVGETLNNIGELQLHLHDQSAAHATLKQVAELIAGIARQDPSSAKVKNALSLARNNYGVVLHRMDRHTEALAEHQKALALREALAQSDPLVVQHRASIADSLLDIGNTQRELGLRDEARRAYDRCCRLYEELLPRQPTATNYRNNLAIAYANRALMDEDARRWEDALTAHSRALAIRDTLLQMCPDVPRYQADVAQSHMYVGRVLCRIDARRYRSLLAATLASAPLAPAAGPHSLLASVQVSPDDTDRHVSEAARNQFDDAVAILTRLVNDHPAAVEFQVDLGNTYSNLGYMYHDDKQHLEAFKWYKNARDTWQKIILSAPGDPHYREWLANAHYDYGVNLQDLRLALAAHSAHKLALEIREKLAKEFPDNMRHVRNLAESHNSIGIATLSLRRRPEALESFEKAHAGFKFVQERDPDGRADRDYDTARRLSDTARGLLNRGITFVEMGKPDDGLPLLRESLPIHEAAMAQRPDRFRYRDLVSKTYRQIAKGQRQQGKLADAAATEQERARLWATVPAEQAATASDLALCIPLVGKEGTPLTEAEQAERRRYADQAMELLRQACDAGFHDAEKLMNDANLEPLRTRDDFRELLARCAAKS